MKRANQTTFQKWTNLKMIRAFIFALCSLFIAGAVEAQVSISPTSYSYGAVTQFTTRDSTSLVVTNNSGSTITFSGNAFSGPNSADFSVFSNGCIGSLVNGGTCPLVVRFQPIAAPPTHETATLIFNYIGAAGSPINVSLDGTSGPAGSTTAISAQVIDSDTIQWANGTWSVSFVPNPSFSGQYQYLGSPFIPQLQSGTMDSAGNLNINVPANNFITPSGTQWSFVICPNASAQCTTFTTPVTGTSLNFTTLFANVKAPRFATSAGSFGYSNVEVTPIPQPGGFYYNVQSLCQEVWSGTSFSCGSGGGGTATNLQGPGSINGTFNGNATLTGTLSCGPGCTISTSGGTINATTAITAQSLSAPSALPSGTTSVTQACIDNSTLIATDAFVLGCSPGGGGSPAGNNGDVQIKNGASFAAGGENDDGTNFNVSRGEHNIGPDPWSDVCLHGALCGATASSTTANTAGTTAVTLASAASFKNGQGITIQHAGAAPSITSLGTITLTPSQNAGGLNTVAANAGSTSSSYKVVAVDKACGYLAATSAVSTTTGNILGLQSTNITSMSRSGTTVTVAATAHNLVVGAMIYIKYIVAGGTNADLTFDGFYKVATVPDANHFTFLGGYDTTTGGTTSDTGGIVISFNGNTLSWTAVAGAFKYAIYGRTTGGYNLIGQTLDHFWVDYGSPMNDNQTFPSCLPTTAPSSGANDNLTTTIVSGATTTSLVLANAATATVSGATAVSDDSPAFVASCIINAPTCYVPQAGIKLRSYTILPGQIKILMNGPIATDDTLELGPATVVEGWRGPSNLSFAWRGSGAQITGSAYPQLSIAGSAINISNMSITCPAQNGCLQMADYAANSIGNAAVTNFSMDYSTMNTGGGTTSDYLGMNAIFQNDGFGFYFDKSTFSTGSPGTNAEASIGNSPIPSIVFKNALGVAGAPTGNFFFDRSWMVARGSVDQDYVSNSGGINFVSAHHIQTQNSFLPQFMVTGAGAAAITNQFDFEDIVPADFPTANFANLSGNVGGATFIRTMTPMQGSNPNTTGAQMVPMFVFNANIGQNSNLAALNSFTNLPVNVMGGGNIGFAMPPPSAPTVAISGASGPPANTYKYSLAAVDTGNRTSSVGTESAPITVNGSQGVLVTFGTPSPGQVASTVCRSNGGAPVCASVGAGFQITGTSFLDNGAFFPNNSANQENTGAASTVINANGSATFAQKIVANNFATTITGTSTAARAQSLADVSGTFCYTTSNCVNVLNGAFYGYTTNGYNACIAASESTHLLCDMRGSPSITFGSTINFGDVAQDLGGILLPCGATLGTTITTGLTPGFVIWPNFKVRGCGIFPTGTVLQSANSSTSVTNIVTTAFVSSVPQVGYYDFGDFTVRNNCASCQTTTNGNAIELAGMVDGSNWGNISAFDYFETGNIMHISQACCSIKLDNIVLRGDANTTCTPSCSANGLLIDYTGTSTSLYALNGTQSSVGHVSASGYLVKLNNTGAAGKLDVNWGTAFSEMTTSATGPCWDVSGTVLLHIAQIEGCATTGATIQIENVGIPAVSFDSLHIGGGGATSVAVKNLNTSLCASTPCQTFTDASGFRNYFTTYVTNTSSASPAAEGNAQMGAFVIAAAASSVVVNTTQTPDDISKIDVRFNTALGTRLGVTCNTTGQQPFISAFTPGTSFTVNVNANFTTNPGCFTFSIK